jgi:hypothetical protein
MELKIFLPKRAKILVKEEEKIEFNQPIFQINSEKEIIVDVNDQLKIAPNKIFNYLKKFIGDEIKKNEVLAEKKGFFGTKKILSPAEGTIKEINHETGTVTITTLLYKKIVKSYFKGKVKGISKDELTVSIAPAISFPIKNASGDFGGLCFYLKPNQQIDAELVEKKIIITSLINTIDQIKLEALGAAGIVTIKPLPNQPKIPFCYLKNISDFEKILKANFSACTISKNQGKIIFYD